MQKNACSNKTLGFTLVELMVAISVLIILTGAAIAVINPVAQRKKAEDGIRQSNLEKYALGVEAYANANGRYPTATEMGVDSNNVPTNTEVRVFISKIPNGEPTATAIYTYSGVSDGASFGISVPKASVTSSCFKYRSTWGKIKECSSNCSGGSDGC